MPFKKTIQLDQILLESDNQYRFQLDEDHIAEIEASYRADDEVEPPRVWKFDDKFLVSRGFHRRTAAERAGLKELECWVHEGTVRDFKIDCITGNAKHGLKLNSKEKRYAVAELLRIAPEFSNPRIALEIGCSVSTAAEIRKELEDHQDIPEVTERVGADGKTRKSRQAKVDVVKEQPKTIAPAVPVAEAKEEYTEVPSEVKPEKPAPELPAAKPARLPTAPTINMPKKQVATSDVHPINDWFMPNAEEAEGFAQDMRLWVAGLESIRSDVRTAFPFANHVMAQRINSIEVLVMLGQLIEVLREQIPERTCPACVGTMSVEGRSCKLCDGYGIVSQIHADALKGHWEETHERYEELTNKAKLMEMER